jgi:hypothetical protein
MLPILPNTGADRGADYPLEGLKMGYMVYEKDSEGGAPRRVCLATSPEAALLRFGDGASLAAPSLSRRRKSFVGIGGAPGGVFGRPS